MESNERVKKILYQIYRSRGLNLRETPLKNCRVCGNEATHVRKKNLDERYCSKVCSAAHYGLSELFPLGMKRVLESVDQHLWLMDLPSEILAQILLMIFDFQILTVNEWKLLYKISEEFEKVQKLRNVIAFQVYPSLKFITPRALRTVPFRTMHSLRGLTRLDFPQNMNTNWTPVLFWMKNLTFLDMTMYDEEKSTIDLRQLTQVNKLVLYKGATNEFIQNLDQIKDLALPSETPITMDAIIQHTQLTALNLSSYKKDLNGMTLDDLSNLRKLSLENCLNITNGDITNLVQLRKLNMRRSNVSDTVFSVLTNLETLKIQLGHKIHNKALSTMTQLTSLHMEGLFNINNETLQQLTNLRKLSLCGGATQFHPGFIGGYIPSPEIDNALLYLTNLTHLNLKKNTKVRDAHLVNMTKLHFLNISIRSNITNEGLRRMTNLRVLEFAGNENITSKIMSFLPELQEIRLSADVYSENGFKQMKKSIYLKISLF